MIFFGICFENPHNRKTKVKLKYGGFNHDTAKIFECVSKIN